MSASMVQLHKLSLFVLGHLLVLTACQSGNGCPTPAAELRAMTCIDPAVISGAPQSAGHVMLSDISQISSKGVTCEKNNNELMAKFPAASGATMLIGTATCKIVSVGLSKGDSNAAQMRLGFEKCSSGPSSGSVLLDVAKVSDKFMALPKNGTFASFINHACIHNTPAPTSSLESTRVEAEEAMLGGNTCSGEILKSWANVEKHACKMLCLAHVTKYNGVFNAEQCGGYAFNSKATSGKVCHLYKGKSVTSVSKSEDTSEWNCWNMTTHVIKIPVSTPSPPTAAELATADESLPRLNIVLPDAKAASILTYTTMNTMCHQSFQVITIQDAAFQTVSVKVKSSEWQTLMDMIPNAAPLPRRLAAATGDVSSVLADRVIYGPSGAALPMAAAPALDGSAAGAPTAGTAAPRTCKPMPPASSMPISVILTNIVLGVAVFACGFGGFKGGQMAASHRVNVAKSGYQPITDAKL